MAETQIYDKLFFRIFSIPERAADLVRNVAPKPVLSRIDLKRIHIDERSYVDKKLRRHFSDVLIHFECVDRGGVFGEGPPHGSGRFSAGSSDKKELYIYILFDHKSRPDKWVSFQLWRYLGNIYRSILDAKKEKEEEEEKEEEAAGPPERLPEVVPVVFYHGREEWNSSLQTADLINYTEERDYIPHFEPIFYDLNEIDERKLVGTIQTVAALVFFKYIKRDFTKDEWAAGKILERKFGLSEEEAAEIDRIEDLEVLDSAFETLIDASEKRQVMEKLRMKKY